MADVTVKRTEDFEPTFRGGMLKARVRPRRDLVRDAGDAAAAASRSVPGARPRRDGQEEVYHRARRGGDPDASAARTIELDARCLRPGRPERDPQADHRRRGRPRCWRSGASLASPSRSPSSPKRARPTRSPRRRPEPMADVTVKRVEDFEAIFGGGFRRARAGLGVSSFGLAVMDLPPNFTELPGPRPGPRPPGGGLHAAQRPGPIRVGGEDGEEYELEPGSGSASGADERRKIITGDEPARVLAIGGSPGRGLRAARVHRGGRHAAADGQARAPLTRALGRGQRNRSASAGRCRVAAAPGPSSSDHSARSRGRAPPGGASPWRGPGRRRRRAGRRPRSRSPRARGRRASVRPRQSSSGTSPAQPIATSAWPSRHGRPKLSAITHAGARRRSLLRARARMRRAEASASAGSRATRLVAGHVRASIPALAQTQPAFVSTISTAALGADDAARLREDQLDERGGPCRVSAPSSPGSLAGLDAAPGRDPPLGLRDDLLRDRRSTSPSASVAPAATAAAAISSPSRSPRPTSGRPERDDLESRLIRLAGRDGPSRASAAAVAGARSGSSASTARERREVVRRVEVERQRVERLDRDVVAGALGPVGVALAAARPERRPDRVGGARSERVGAGAVAVGDDRDPARRPCVPSAASSSAGSSSGQSPGSSADALRRRARARG